MTWIEARRRVLEVEPGARCRQTVTGAWVVEYVRSTYGSHVEVNSGWSHVETEEAAWLAAAERLGVGE